MSPNWSTIFGQFLKGEYIMKKIFKYKLMITGLQTVVMPKDAEILSVQVQYNDICIWALVDPKNELIERGFNIFGTGHEIPETVGKYIGTFQIDDGRLVFHLFEFE